MTKQGRVIIMQLGRIDRKAMLKFLQDSVKGLDREQDKIGPKEYELARKTLRHILKKIRKVPANQEFSLAQQEYDYLRLSLKQIVEHNATAFDNMWFLKRWFYKMLSKNYDHLYEVVKRRKS